MWDHDIDAEGKITAIHRDRAIGIEMKTCRGHFAKKEIFGIGNKMYPMGKPKMEHIMQAAMYLMMREKHEKHYGVTIDHYLIFYFAVDTANTLNSRLLYPMDMMVKSSKRWTESLWNPMWLTN